MRDDRFGILDSLNRTALYEVTTRIDTVQPVPRNTSLIGDAAYAQSQRSCFLDIIHSGRPVSTAQRDVLCQGLCRRLHVKGYKRHFHMPAVK